MKLIFGAIYLLIAVVFAVHFYLNIFSFALSLILSIYLIAKGIIFTFMKMNFLSLIDVIAGLYFLLLILGAFPNTFVTIISLLYLVQKGFVYSLRGLS